MKKFIATAFFIIIGLAVLHAQTAPTAKTKPAGASIKPKLVIGLVVDQMRWDYLYRFSGNYTSGGFKRLLSQGYSFENTLINYTPTYTAAGHTCVYTGSVPAIHGIMGNNWFDKRTGKNIYCTDDSTVLPVGSSSRAGKMSPDNLWASTITDELKMSNNFKSKVIGIALKDRGAILPAGHSANAAYWYDDAAGKFITSSYYMMQLPDWVNNFNNKDLPTGYMAKDWNTLFSIDKYILSTPDDKAYEIPIPGEKKPVFPHRMREIKSGKYSAFKYTPYANSFTFDFAKASIENEKLGAGDVTDFLAVSISSTDYIGHNFGPNSIEIEDTYYRLDNDIADFLLYLDAKLGKGNYLFFLTADHGVAHIPAYLNENKLPGGTFDDYAFVSEINKALSDEFGINNIIQNSQNYQLYLNIAEIQKKGKDEAAIKKMIIQLLKAKPYIINVFETDKLFQTTLPQPQKEMMANGYNPVRSGDIMFTVKPAYFDGGARGTTHGLWNPYDAHIPNVWFGWKIPKGKSNRETYMTDIAPTVAALLQIQMPNGNVGKVLEEVVK
jgi:predicted AlkP superfamily pyrophosphatase or phosphodiesterase